MDAKTKKCPACGALLNVEAKFCNECGCKQVADEIELDEEEFSDKDRPPISIEEAYNLLACDKYYKENNSITSYAQSFKTNPAVYTLLGMKLFEERSEEKKRIIDRWCAVWNQKAENEWRRTQLEKVTRLKTALSAVTMLFCKASDEKFRAELEEPLVDFQTSKLLEVVKNIGMDGIIDKKDYDRLISTMKDLGLYESKFKEKTLETIYSFAQKNSIKILSTEEDSCQHFKNLVKKYFEKNSINPLSPLEEKHYYHLQFLAEEAGLSEPSFKMIINELCPNLNSKKEEVTEEIKTLYLSKGQKVDLTKDRPNLNTLTVCLGWKVRGEDFDIDVSAFMLGSNGKCPSDDEFIFYSNPKHPSDSIKLNEDNNRQIRVDLSKIPANIERIAFTCTIYDAEAKGQDFSKVDAAFISLTDQRSNKEIIHYDLGKDFSTETALVAGEIYKHKNQWKFNAIGSGFSGGLKALCSHYGIEVEN